jgi:hypothetical protein
MTSDAFLLSPLDTQKAHWMPYTLNLLYPENVFSLVYFVSNHFQMTFLSLSRSFLSSLDDKKFLLCYRREIVDKSDVIYRKLCVNNPFLIKTTK